MKKLIVLVALVGCWGVADAQLWVLNGNALENTTSAAVNIGSNNGFRDARIQIGDSRSENGNAYFDLIADVNTFSDFGARLIRFADGRTRFDHRGTQPLEFKTADAGGTFRFLRQGDALSMAINSDGKVGIGTDDPGSFTLAVEGMVGSREVQVTATSPFPDYVFADNYTILSLDELEDYIEKNKHLPNIPSAKEVEDAGGFKLGEMNIKLLEKVEELTLYIIEQNKKLKVLEEKIEKIKAQK